MLRFGIDNNVVSESRYVSERDVMAAFKSSLFIRAIHSIDISFGQLASHSPVFVQAPNISSSIFATIFSAR